MNALPDVTTDLSHQLPELNQIESLVQSAPDFARMFTLGKVTTANNTFPLYGITMGSDSPDVPAFGIFGGVHGVERIGSEVVLSYLHSLIELLNWSSAIREQLQKIRLVFIPVVNPGGMYNGTRCNPRGVDLMRNAPVEAHEKVPLLVGGQRISRELPWFRGEKNQAMEIESEALCQFVQENLFNSQFSMALDCHSGYGRKDHIWFPYAWTRKPFHHLPEMLKLSRLFNQTYPYHTIYEFEPQSLHYTTHGDLWDYLYLESLKRKNLTFLPLTLEMGSWLWVKKNPRQLLRFFSLFNPMLPHRHQRILRRHLLLIDFLFRAVQDYKNWLPNSIERRQLQREAYSQWYTSHES